LEQHGHVTISSSVENRPEKYYDTIDKSNNRIDWICTIFGITKEIAEQGGVLSFDPKDGGDEIEVTVLSDPDQLTRIWADEKLPPLIIPDEFITQSGTRIVKSQKFPGESNSSTCPGDRRLGIPIS
jgi:hypothetical protein